MTTNEIFDEIYKVADGEATSEMEFDKSSVGFNSILTSITSSEVGLKPIISKFLI